MAPPQTNKMTLEKWLWWLKLAPTSLVFLSPGFFYLLNVFISKTFDASIAVEIIDAKQYFLFFSFIGLIPVAILILVVRSRFPGFLNAAGRPPKNLTKYFTDHANECNYPMVCAYTTLYLLLHFFFGSVFFSFILFI